MDEKDRLIQRLTQDVARLKNRILEIAEKACFNCEEYVGRNEDRCKECRVKRFKEDTTK